MCLGEAKGTAGAPGWLQALGPSFCRRVDASKASSDGTHRNGSNRGTHLVALLELALHVVALRGGLALSGGGSGGGGATIALLAHLQRSREERRRQAEGR